MFRIFVAILAVSTLTAGAERADAATISDTFSSFFVLGDSLSDPGNLPTGRFTDGRVWAEPISDRFTAAGTTRNYAKGGGRAVGTDFNDLGTQVLEFSRDVSDGSVTLGSRPLVAIWMGANDVFSALFPDPTRPGGDVINPVDAARAVVRTIADLARDGISRDFLVFDLPDQGETPLARFTSTEELLRTRSDAFNTTLTAELAMLAPDITTYTVPIAERFAELLDDPSSIGLGDFTLPCNTSPPADRTKCQFIADATGADIPPPAVLFGFNDEVHPNSVVHAEITRVASAAVVPLPASAPLMLAGFGALLIVRRRRAAA
ncbi:MAG: SGNH/GDSL hydrolase family protein [Pseudomonadota bacterium]